MAIGPQLAGLGQVLQRGLFQHGLVPVDEVSTLGDSTKKPPLIRPLSDGGFSMNRSTVSPLIFRAPKRARGVTAVIVASAPWASWKRSSAPTSTSDRPSP